MAKRSVHYRKAEQFLDCIEQVRTTKTGPTLPNLVATGILVIGHGVLSLAELRVEQEANPQNGKEEAESYAGDPPAS